MGQEQGNGKFDSWAVVEMFGHQRIAGRVTEQTIGGCSFLRVDVPEVEARTVKKRVYSDAPPYGLVDREYVLPALPAFTKFLTQGAIYAMTPCTEAVARATVERDRYDPIERLNLPTAAKALPAPAGGATPVDVEAEDAEDQDEGEDEAGTRDEDDG
jgi:hypothetical protein